MKFFAGLESQPLVVEPTAGHVHRLANQTDNYSANKEGRQGRSVAGSADRQRVQRRQEKIVDGQTTQGRRQKSRFQSSPPPGHDNRQYERDKGGPIAQ